MMQIVKVFGFKGQMNSVNDIRKTFLDFFAERGHETVPSSPLVPINDPSLLFTNAGMVQFKNVFIGAETRPYSRAASSQKCVRAGGKHNDLDNVGYTARHHTFFEMLGNFSFGDYFKAEAIEYAWELVHRVFNLPADRLLVTVYHEDEEAFSLWKKIAGLPDDRILKIATSDNFWSMGETGPCGPCSEIFYDHGEDIPGGPPGSAEEEGDRWVEIWNLVFMQFNQLASGERQALPKPSIDTGMGLERIAAVLQGTHDNYETDLFRSLIEASVAETGVAAEGGNAASHRVIADHLRATSFLIADGVLPSNDGRGYVLRRIMRRAMRHAHLLGATEPLLYKLVPVLSGLMGAAFPELNRGESLIVETLKVEEDRFRQTLDRGLKLLTEEVAKLPGKADLPGEVAFKLYDTYGFPLDLTQDAMRAEGRGVDLEGFEAAMERQRAEARAAWAGSGEAATEQVWFDLREQAGATEFVGYTASAAEGKVQAIIADGAQIESAKPGDEIHVIVNQTPFYGESGGQLGDTGTITGENLKAEVLDTQKHLGDLHAHRAKVTEGRIKVGDTVHLAIDEDRRRRLRANHSATHVLHEVLRRVLGTHVTQKGSLVAPDRLRFDFSHPKALTREEIERIDDEVNAVIRQNEDVVTRLMSYDEAIEAGALALFGEKYDDEVRVVSMGRDAGGREMFSTELCGGTHVRRLGDIALFKIIAESAVSAGVRRVEALTGEAAWNYLLEEERQLREAAATLKVAPGELPERVRTLNDERKRLEQQLAEARKKLALGGDGASTGPEAEDIGGISFLGQTVEGVSPKELRSLADEAKKRVESGVIGFVGVNDGKAALLVAVTDDLTGRLSAVDLVRAAAGPVGGKGGGGRPDMAQAGGPDPSGAEAALDAIRKRIADEAKAA